MPPRSARGGRGDRHRGLPPPRRARRWSTGTGAMSTRFIPPGAIVMRRGDPQHRTCSGCRAARHARGAGAARAPRLALAAVARGGRCVFPSATPRRSRSCPVFHETPSALHARHSGDTLRAWRPTTSTRACAASARASGWRSTTSASGIEALDADPVFCRRCAASPPRGAPLRAHWFGWPREGRPSFAPEGYEVAYRTNAVTSTASTAIAAVALADRRHRPPRRLRPPLRAARPVARR